MEFIELNGVHSDSTPPRPHPTVEFLPAPADPFIPHEHDHSDTDIYRGGPPSPPRTPRPDSMSSSSSSSSSSSGSFVFGGRLGAISQLVEHAISHWARAWASSSSLTSSTSSSSSSSSESTNSILTRARSRASRKRSRRSSTADLHNAKSEREISARIRAREQARQIPREFSLYHPPGEGASKSQGDPLPLGSDEQDGVLQTDSLSLIISRLSIALKDHLRSRRAREIAQSTPSSEPSSLEQSISSTPSLHFTTHVPVDPSSLPSSTLASSVDPLHRRGRKGKSKVGKAGFSSTPRLAERERDMGKAWWLDVASPTPQDMRAIGKLLQIHPLTLEDILLQDPREKFELFPSLGYYFIAFRTIESTRTRERRRLRLYGTAGQNLGVLDEGIVGIVNVYLVVFREGVCSFHFADISDHTETVRNRVRKLDDPATMSPDWIAHGIMDSIVDSFFPFLEDIEKEVAAIESLVFSTSAAGGIDQSNLIASSSSVTVVSPSPTSQKSLPMERRDPLMMKHEDTIHSTGAKTHFSLPRRPRRMWRAVQGYLRTLRAFLPFHGRDDESAPSKASSTIHRMARTRRLVTSLTRVLAAKSEVVTQLKKRLLKTGGAGLGEGMGDDRDVFMYMGDVQDHILTLQQALAHYERMLSQSHPIYLSELRLGVSKTKAGADKAIVFLSVISVGVLCVQTLIGLHSMNIHIPANRLPSKDPPMPGGPFNVFIIIIALSVVIVTVYGAVVRTWWVRAKRRRAHL
ncbi:hypothetical protein BXZ70DRAFT_938323 [Cristinia sonorae]|uniref:Uncharacterized protein n=1 Tax=Cristinia sonorae TaxID=1940300 RepID=A0A8K0UPN4_9AGAR|nr:hypothetical protein BXZ70DRAFT_938323 [Cristinia sonorae]